MVFNLIFYYEMELIMKKLVIALMAFALVITLAGCGGGGGGSKAFVLDRGDDGKGLTDNGFTDVKKSYDDINTVFKNNDSSSDANGNIRGNAFAEAISENYTGTNKTHSDGSVTKVSTKAELVARLKSLIKSKQFEGLEIIPYQTKNGATATNVVEKTKLYVASFKHNGSTYTNKEYVFDSIKWVKEDSGWKIVSGFDDLGKTASELAGI